VVVAPCPRCHPQPDAVLLENHRGSVVSCQGQCVSVLAPGPTLAARRFARLWTYSLCSQKAPTRHAVARSYRHAMPLHWSGDGRAACCFWPKSTLREGCAY
jgi:hypothetical protein